MKRELIKTDRNGTKYYRQECTCWKCYGTGTFYWGPVINGQPSRSGVCFACGGDGVTTETVKEYTPEHQAKLDAQREKREAKRAEEAAKAEAERKARNDEQARRKADREAQWAAEKAQSNYVGSVGDRLELEVSYKFKVKYESQFGTVKIYSFKDADGNTLVWKTTSGYLWADGEKENGGNVIAQKGDKIKIKATVKEHSEYKGEKQTILNRVKLLEIIEKAQEVG